MHQEIEEATKVGGCINLERVKSAASGCTTLVFIALCISGTARQAQAGIVSVGPFTGSASETWEEFSNYRTPSFHYLPDATPIFGGLAEISNPTMIVYQAGTPAFFGLNSSGIAQVSDGTKGMGIDQAASTTTIDFATPVTSFGGYWGCMYRQPILRPGDGRCRLLRHFFEPDRHRAIRIFAIFD